MSSLLDKINSPQDLKALRIDDLYKLSEEIRSFIIRTVADTGGHLASNLGVVELTIALHYHLNSPEDKIIWDVGHQSYTHKILTGRKDKFYTIRQYKGLSGFPKRKESIHDIIETGHSSTSISTGLGLALARDLNKRKERIYSVIGDGSLTAGMAFEALNHAGSLGTDLKVILNDNGMSIDQNVGALSRYISNIRTAPRIHKIKEDLEFIISKIPKIGPTVSKSVERVKDGFKYIFLSGILFEEMGFTYIGPLDGHNINELLVNFKNADNIEGPVLIHITTVKGKGYKPAEKHPVKYHGVNPFIIGNGEQKKENKRAEYSQIFGETMLKIAEEDDRVLGITAAMPEGTGLSIFRDKYPERYIDVGIAEQHALSLASGLAAGGKKPVVAIYSSFLQRAYDQLIHDICIPEFPVTIAVDRSGIVGSDGETHQGIYDNSFLRIVPGLIIMAPRDENQLQHMLYTAVNCGKPAVIKYPRGEIIGIEMDQGLKELQIGKGELLLEGEDLLIIAVGSTVYPALEAAEMLERHGIRAGVIDACFIKPLDGDLLLDNIKQYRKVLIVEENVLNGGFGSAVMELLNENQVYDVEIKRSGLPDIFLEHGPQELFRKLYKLDSTGIYETALEFVSEGLEVYNYGR
ncbi:MAG: 1-deoxy-D-xylulose-5-phosphate synthase [Halanaerobiaceae bacterium]|nr:1-deoxy-D-xylulose-5-phosphate synthase [Halanaerobiaceae bacterium]